MAQPRILEGQVKPLGIIVPKKGENGAQLTGKNASLRMSYSTSKENLCLPEILRFIRMFTNSFSKLNSNVATVHLQGRSGVIIAGWLASKKGPVPGEVDEIFNYTH